MPTSPWNSITPIMSVIMELQPIPARVLDIGIGYGKYGLLCKEFLQFWNSPDQPRKITIDGIEAFPKYVGGLQKQIYDHIHIGDALDILPSFPNSGYDLVLMIDVLEHFDKAVGFTIINEISRVGKVAIISTPRQFWKQLDSWGNPFERHKSLWSKQDLIHTGASQVLRNENWIAIYAQEPFSKNFTYHYRLYRKYQNIKRTIGL